METPATRVDTPTTSTLDPDRNPKGISSAEIPAGRAALSGVAAAAAALASGELLGAFSSPRPSPLIAVSNRVIEYAPGWFIEFGKGVFGLADKPALVLGTTIISFALGAFFGFKGRHNQRIAIGGIVAFGLIGALAMGADAQGTWPSAILMAAVSVAAGVGSLIWLFQKAGGQATLSAPQRGLTSRPDSAASMAATKGPETLAPEMPLDNPVDPAVSRRSFFGWAGVVGVTAAVAAAGAQSMRSRSRTELARQTVELEVVDNSAIDSVVSVAQTSEVGSVPGITPLIVPNDEFYLIDTALIEPLVDADTWSMTIKGMVENEVTYSYDDLLSRASVTAPVTLSCVSNEVGGNLVGNAVWQGVPLVELLEEAGVLPGATQLSSRSVDGWTCGFPTEAAFDGRTALVAVGMNDEPLPISHGFPARLVVSGLYGYVSATKWLQEIELTTFEDFNGYWIDKGWSKLGPVKTQARIDTPRSGSTVEAGTDVAIAGVAWAPNTGIERVEVQIGDEPWQDAMLGESLGADAWRQWYVPWKPRAGGQYEIRVRATDSSGQTQTSESAPPAPSGATGWHTIAVRT